MSMTKEVPNRDYIELTFVRETATGRGLNTQFVMENTGDGYFHVTDGRVGIKVGPHKPKEYNRPMEDWDGLFRSKLSRGYLVTKTKKMGHKTVQKAEYAPISNPSVNEIVERLRSYANTAMENNFTVRVEDISDEMLTYGADILSVLHKNSSAMSVAEFNGKLKVLYSAVPRRIDKLSDHLASTKKDFARILDREQELYDMMTAQVRSTNACGTQEKTILDVLGIEIRPETEEEMEDTRRLLKGQAGHYLHSWRIINHSTQRNFDEYCAKEHLTDGSGIDRLFHGSRHENWWSIISNGLLLHPDAQITGKAYGIGTYFAPDAVKSLGYTSRAGAKYTDGTMETGFMGIYRVATGNRYDGHLGTDHTLNYRKLQEIQPGAHCTWAECRYSGFMMDEVIVYQECQSDIERLVELKF